MIDYFKISEDGESYILEGVYDLDGLDLITPVARVCFTEVLSKSEAYEVIVMLRNRVQVKYPEKEIVE